MSPRKSPEPITDRVAQAARRLASDMGSEIHDERVRRHWTLRELGRRSGLTAAAIQRLEGGLPGSVETYARVSVALTRRPELHLLDERRLAAQRAEDPVHAWLGDVEAARFQLLGLSVAIDEPFQHFQFAGRADVVSWSIERRALLHIENRTRFPNLQEAAGSYNAKRAHLAPAIADRLKVRGGFASVTHVMVGLWSAEVQHALRLRTATFRALCPDPADAFAGWWDGEPPPSGARSTFILLDPLDRGRSRRWVGLEDALSARPRYRGYAEAVAELRDSLKS